MAVVPVMSFGMFWNSSDSDLSKCDKCKEVIYGKMFYPVIDIEESGKVETTTFNEVSIKLCSPCYNAYTGN